MSRWITRWRWGFGGVRRATVRAARLVKEADQAREYHHYEAALPLYEESLSVFRELEHWQGAFSVRLRLIVDNWAYFSDAQKAEVQKYTVGMWRNARDPRFFGYNILNPVDEIIVRTLLRDEAGAQEKLTTWILTK